MENPPVSNLPSAVELWQRQTTGWNTWINSRASDGMFSKLSTVQTREDCTSILLSSGCPAKVASSLYGLSVEKDGSTPTSGVVERAESLSLLLGATQARMSLLLLEAVEAKENLPEGLTQPKLVRQSRTTDTPTSESSGGSDWSSCSSDRRHLEELSSGSTSEWGISGSQSSSDTCASGTPTSSSSVELDETSSPPSPTGFARSIKKAKLSLGDRYVQSSLTFPEPTKPGSPPQASKGSKTDSTARASTAAAWSCSSSPSTSSSSQTHDQ